MDAGRCGADRGADPHENWWCRDGGVWWNRGSSESCSLPPFARPRFEDLDDSVEERSELLAHGSGPTFLLEAAYRWAVEDPADPRAPEALHLAILGARWSCPDERPRYAAERAFTILHRKSGKTEWAKKTPYWYDGT